MNHVVTLVAARPPLDPAAVERVRAFLRGATPRVLAADEAVDIPLAEVPDMAGIAAVLQGSAIDAIPTSAVGRRKKLLVADMDSTIVTAETLDELAAHAGLKEQIAAITRRSMNGEIDFIAALRERVAKLRGLPLAALEATWRGVRLTEGARDLVATMHRHGAICALASGGFTFFSERVAARVGFDAHFANRLLDDGVALTGQVAEPILDRGAKLRTLLALTNELGLAPEETMAVGDGANDLEMLRAAGLGVAFHAKPIVAATARARVDHGNLRALLFAQGYRESEIVSSPD